MVYGGLWWFMVVYGGLMVVYGGLWWFNGGLMVV